MSLDSEKFSRVEPVVSVRLDAILVTASKVDSDLASSLREAALFLLSVERRKVGKKLEDGIGTLIEGIESRRKPTREEGKAYFAGKQLERRGLNTERLRYIEQCEEAVRSASPYELTLNLEDYLKARSEGPATLEGVRFDFHRQIRLVKADASSVE
jgi:hypothetical protein